MPFDDNGEEERLGNPMLPGDYSAPRIR